VTGSTVRLWGRATMYAKMGTHTKVIFFTQRDMEKDSANIPMEECTRVPLVMESLMMLELSSIRVVLYTRDISRMDLSMAKDCSTKKMALNARVLGRMGLEKI